MAASDKMIPLTLLKLGGSIVTDKAKHEHYRGQHVRKVAKLLSAYFVQRNEACLIGHGQGSFGHPAVKKNQRHFSNRSHFAPQAMAEMLRVVTHLHELILDDLVRERVPAISFRFSQQYVVDGAAEARVDLTLLEALLDLRMVPVTTGDILVDTEVGNRVLSTEKIFMALIRALQHSDKYRVERVAYVTQVAGVLDKAGKVIERIGADEEVDQSWFFAQADQADVTGAMKHKVEAAQAVAQLGIPVAILSANDPKNLDRYLRNQAWIGTRIA